MSDKIDNIFSVTTKKRFVFWGDADVCMQNEDYFVVAKEKVTKKKVNSAMKDNELSIYFKEGKSKCILLSREKN